MIFIRRLKHYLFLSFFFCICVSLTRCSKIEDVGLTSNSESILVNSIDTFNITTSTFMLDPIPTGGSGKLLIGTYDDPYIGKNTVTPYFRLNLPSLENEYPIDSRFDSLTLQLNYNGDFYGDTTKAIALSVYRLTQDIEPKELPIALEGDEYPVFVSGATLYADQQFEHEDTALGSLSFFPKPKSGKDTINIRLNQNWGETLFDMALKRDTKLLNSEEFYEYLKGFVLESEDAASIIGLRDSLTLFLHYSYENQTNGNRVSKTISMNIGNASYQFNAVKTERSSYPLQGLSYTHQELPTSSTGNRTFVQGLSGIVTRIHFPNIRQGFGDGITVINNAKLIVETDQSPAANNPPPETLILMIANRYGTPTSLLTNGSQISVSASYQSNGQDDGSSRGGKYVFDITDYIERIRKTTSYNENESLLLSLQTDDLLSSMKTLHISPGENKSAIKLNVIYTKIQ